MEWIEINLPFFIQDLELPIPPDLEQKAKEELGYCFSDICFLSNNEEMKKKYDQYFQWEEYQAEHIEYLKNLDIKTAEWEKSKKLSFCGSGLNIPGTLIEIKNNNEIKEYLIGDIDPNGGQFQRNEISLDAIVLRYKIVWRK